ncbi:MAG TPA: DUF3093 domain-containing protein [Marmoricola sp.]|nr:DUF3093 domain-containing protein [Marmoricola sp.]
MPASGPVYDERLHVPLRWWVQATMLLACLWLAFVVAMPVWAAFTLTGVLVVLVLGLLLWVGSVRVRVSEGVLRAGRAHIAVDLLGVPRLLDAEGTRRAMGVEADARAFLVTRPYLKRSVLLPVEDARDPTPYWLVSTRQPERLAAALREAVPGSP